MITALGRVELDITKVPTSTLSEGRDRESFEGRLRDTQGPLHKEGSRPTGRVDSRNPRPPEADDTGAHSSTHSDTHSDTDTNTHPGTAVRGDRDGNEVHRESNRTFGKGSTRAGDTTDNTAAASNQGARPQNPAASRDALLRQAPPPVPQGEAQPQGGQGATSLTKAQGGLQPGPAATSHGSQQPHARPDAQGQEARAVAEVPGREAPGKTGRTASRPAPVGYRSVSTATLAASEAARDSVIRQIVLELGPDGGRMRMHLSPPELGRLDLHMVVEKGAVLQLSIAAERPEVLMMLDKHIPELRQALAQQGLDLSGADVQTSLFEHREHGSGSPSRQGDDLTMSHQQPEVATTPRHLGYVTTDGLDFWV